MSLVMDALTRPFSSTSLGCENLGTVGRQMNFDVRAIALAFGVLALCACKGGPKKEGLAEGIVSLSAAAEKDVDPATMPKEGGPRIGAVQMGAPIYAKPDRRSPKLGYLRAGGTAVRGENLRRSTIAKADITAFCPLATSARAKKLRSI